MDHPQDPQCRLTPDMIWSKRRKDLGGKSAVTGAPLPNRLDDCNASVQADHYSQACYAMCAYEIPQAWISGPVALREETLRVVPIPRDVTLDKALEIRNEAIRQHLADQGYYG